MYLHTKITYPHLHINILFRRGNQQAGTREQERHTCGAVPFGQLLAVTAENEGNVCEIGDLPARSLVDANLCVE